MAEASAFVPGHISGFFQVYESNEPARSGSRNCGPCISAGVRTNVEVVEDKDTNIEIIINGQKRPAGSTMRGVEELIKRKDKKASIKVEHIVKAPIGAGYGTSGAGTIGAILAVSEALELNITREEILSIAHISEVNCKSGLGDVGPQMKGGLVIGLEPGSPPYGSWEAIKVERDIVVICGTFEPLTTSGFLESEEFVNKTKECGGVAMKNLLSDPTMGKFMEVSKDFTMELGIFDDKFEDVLEDISSESPFGASAVMLGRAVFAPCMPSELGYLRDLFLDYFAPAELMVTKIDFEGARIVS